MKKKTYARTSENLISWCEEKTIQQGILLSASQNKARSRFYQSFDPKKLSVLSLDNLAIYESLSIAELFY
jgi:hypothetical protein